MDKTKDNGKTQDLKSNKSGDTFALLHHRESTANADLKRLANDNIGGVIPAKIPCNKQPEKNLGNSNPAKQPSTANKPESKSGEDIIDVDMLILDQVDEEKFHKV